MNLADRKETKSSKLALVVLPVFLLVVAACASAPFPLGTTETVETPHAVATLALPTTTRTLQSSPTPTGAAVVPRTSPTSTRPAATPTAPQPTTIVATVATQVTRVDAATPQPPTATATISAPQPAPTARTPSLTELALRLEPAASGLDRPLFVTHAGDASGRLFIVEKAGTIRVLEDGRLVAEPFLDIRDRVLSRGSEQGLLGVAFSPDYSSTGHFFVDYTDLAGNTVVSRFTVAADSGVADPSSEFKVLGIAQPAANHNGGMLAFGPDGLLYVGTGDGGAANDRFGNGQNPQTLLGKMLRLDVTTDPAAPYLLPTDNPWVSAAWNGQAVLGEIWALGLRNPWRYSFDRQTGDLWIADVGQNQYEEINRVPARDDGRVVGGLNFGWPIMEGMHCFPDTANCTRDRLTMPVAEYAHGADGCSITGGYVYRGSAISELLGAYVYGDYCSGRIWALIPAAGGAWQSQLLLDSGLSISSFGEDQAGELYVTDLQGGAVYLLAAG